IAEPQCRKDMYQSRLRTAITHANPDENVLRTTLGVLHANIEIAIILKDAGVQQFILGVVSGSLPVLLHQIVIGVGLLRILVQILHVRVRRGAVEIEIVFLDVLPVIALYVGQPEEALLQNGIVAVPQSERKAKELAVVADAGESIFAPVICA